MIALRFKECFFFLLTACLSCTQIKEDTQKPEDNRFSKVVLATHLDEPMQFELLQDGRVLFVERKGKLKVYDPVGKNVKVIADIPVSVGYYSKTGKELSPNGEDGMQGVLLDPGFEHNHFIYLYYTPKEGNVSVLARFTWEGDTLNTASKNILLEVPNQRETCCHLGGGMAFDTEGNLLLSTGDNTSNGPGGFPHMDERPGNSMHDSQGTSSNTNDLRGKILRIHPEEDGSYTIPRGNLFPPGTPGTRPEIYTMGNRNPYRLSIDSKTGFLYWSEVGPGGIVDSPGRGPRSYDEFNQARKAGNFGWPYAAGNNQAYWHYDFAAQKPGERFDTAHPVNRSPNNTGLQQLPPSVPALIWYPQTFSETFPLLGSGSASAMGGPVYRRQNLTDPQRPFPSYYEGKWFITDWSRGWIMAVSMDENGNYQSMEPFLPGLRINGPNDMDFGPDGDLYVLQYGRGPYVKNEDAMLFKIAYNAGNRPPLVKISTDKKAGAVPLRVHLSSDGTIDHDKDPLSYRWDIFSGGRLVMQSNEADPAILLEQPGGYLARITVTDEHGASSGDSIKISAGNEPPVVNIRLEAPNSTFFFPDSALHYSVSVDDREDGSLANKKIDPANVYFNIEYISNGGNLPSGTEAKNEDNAEAPLPFAVQLINTSDCRSCHAIDKPSIGPSFMQVAEKYKNKQRVPAYLAQKIQSGGSGVWGNTTMPPHPGLSDPDAAKMVDYILSLTQNKAHHSLPLRGKFVTLAPAKQKEPNGAFLLTAAYTDKGTAVAPPQTTAVKVLLRNQLVPAMRADAFHEMEIHQEIMQIQSQLVPKTDGAYMQFRNIDLKGIRQIGIGIDGIEENKTSGSIEIRIDSPAGRKIGSIALPPAKPMQKATSAIAAQHEAHDIYFIFSGFGAAGKKIKIRNIKFDHLPLTLDNF
ncbi:MAG TPA: PQQ-dependent sugar dehydrogenase [Agriterribacter sp.]|nr:PQQ-dependent sugar dehydrogenase [Agriterribacter sp.]